MQRSRAVALTKACDIGLSRLQASAPDGAFFKWHGATAFVTCIPSARVNAVLDASFPAAEAKWRAAAVIRRMRKQRPRFGWVVWPSSRPRSLPTILESLGMRHIVDMSIMAAPLRGLDEPHAVSGLQVRRVSTLKQLNDWVSTSMAAFGDSPSERPHILRMERSIGLRSNCPRVLFIGTMGGRPVGTSMVYTEAEACGLFYVGVLPRARRRGVGAALTWAALEEGSDRSCKTATLLATGAGQVVYQRLGFDVYGRGRVYGTAPPAKT